MAKFEIKKIDELVKGHIEGEIVDVKITRLTAPGDNYASLMLKVDLRVKRGCEERVIHAVAKCIPPHTVVQEFFNIQITFKNEIAWYDTIIPTLKQFLKDNGVEQSLDCFADFYGARINLSPGSDVVDKDAVMVNENLTYEGYQTEDRYVGFDLATTKVILRNLAYFHAIPLAIRHKNPKLFEKNIKPYLLDIELLNKAEIPITESFLNFVENDPELKRLSKRIKDSLHACKHFGTSEVQDAWGTIAHTDFWFNNLMVKRAGGEIAVKILDLQMAGYGSPVNDLILFFTTSVQIPVYQKHIEELFRYYYDEFIDIITRLNLTNLNRFSYESFQEEINNRGPEQFFHCVHFVMTVLADKGGQHDNTTEGYNYEEHMKMFSSIRDRHKERYIFLIQEFERRNWI